MTDSRPAAVTLLGPKEHSRAGAVLGRAFYDDPQWAALMPDPDVRQTRLPMMFTGTAKMTVAAGGVAERTSGFEAVALWLRPGRDIGPWAMVRSGVASARWLMTPPVQDFRLMTRVLRQFDRQRKMLMPEPHWYLMAIGVDPRRQGQGFGSALVRSGMRRADRDNKLIYLETETGINVTFYEQLGFEVIEEMNLVDIDLPFSLMIRRPETLS